MCIIFVAKTKRPIDDLLVRAADRNSDGIGIAWREKGKVHWEKGLDVQQLLDRVHKNPPPYPYVMEFRSATTGGELPELCHPFVASPSASIALKGSAKEVLFHNGHWMGWEYKLKESFFHFTDKIPPGPWSDSRALARLVGVYGKEVLEWLDLRNEQRICLFSYDKVSLIGSWSEGDGFLHSNPTHGWMGQINITPKKEYEKEQKQLSKRERIARAWERSKRFIAEPPGETQKLLEAAHNCSVGKKSPKSSAQSNRGFVWGCWRGFEEEDDERQIVPSWKVPEDGGAEEELPTVEVKPDRYWAVEELGEILTELRIFNWRTFNLIRSRQPLRSS